MEKRLFFLYSKLSHLHTFLASRRDINLFEGTRGNFSRACSERRQVFIEWIILGPMGMRAVHVVSRTPGLIVITIIERTIKNGGHVRYRIQWCSYILYVLQTYVEIMF